jgi:GTPase SAR1 family protein
MNPFSAAFGVEPNIFLNREKLIDDLIHDLQNPFSDARSTIVTGLRGSGKTTFLNRIKTKLDDNWIRIQLRNSDHIVSDLIAELKNAIARNISLTSKVNISKYSIFGFTIENEQILGTDQSQLTELLEICKNAGNSVLIMIDEITINEGIRELYSIFQILIGNKLPITMIVAGLPEEVDAVVTDRVLTFLLRSKQISLTPLTVEDVAISYEDHLDLTPNVAMKAAQMTKGYPYAFQLLGKMMYDEEISTESELDDCIEDYRRLLIRNAYRLIGRDLSDIDYQIVKAIANNADPCKIADVIEDTGLSKNMVNTYKYRLLETGLITQPKRGYLSFVLPEFDYFIKTYYSTKE